MGVDKTILEILEIMKASPADYFIFGLGLFVVLCVIHLYRQHKILSEKYHILDKHNLYLWSKVDPDGVRIHHSGEHYMVHPSDRSKCE